MPRDAHPAITDAFEPLVQHLAYAFEVDPQLDRVARAHTLLDEAGPALRAALQAAGARDAEVQLLDLHGMRAAEARAALRTCTEPICVVWFGKGKGVLRDVFLEHFEREDGFLLVDLAGETRERPQEAMGLVLRDDLHAALQRALLQGNAGARAPSPAARPRGASSDPTPPGAARRPEAPPPRAGRSGRALRPAQLGALRWLWGRVLALVLALLRRRP
ncbi:MAG: hypothetical protein RL071_191 [Pseudomonadota bacterium]|jgi:hypothetical protein